jgi:hypothetical protein
MTKSPDKKPAKPPAFNADLEALTDGFLDGVETAAKAWAKKNGRPWRPLHRSILAPIITGRVGIEVDNAMTPPPPRRAQYVMNPSGEVGGHYEYQ